MNVDFDFSFYRKKAEDEILSVMENIAGDKELVIAPDLFSEIDRITSAQKLRGLGVKKLLRLNDKLGAPNYIRVYLIRPFLPFLKMVISLVNENPKSSFEKVHIICVPRVHFMVKRLIEREGLLENVSLRSLPSWELIYLDEDLLSMELDEFFPITFVANDLSWLSSVASALINLQSDVGKIPYVYCIGEMSKYVNSLMENLFSTISEKNISSLNSIKPKIGHLIIVDRSIDYTTLLCSQMIYEGMLDEAFGIDAGVMKVPNSIIKVQPFDKETMMILSSTTDPVFKEIRSIHITDLFGRIRNYAEMVRKEMDDRKKRIHHDNVQELKAMVQKELKGLFEKERLLQRHLALAEFIMHVKTEIDFKDQLHMEQNVLLRSHYKECLEFVEVRMNRGLDWARTLQLMCLMSSCFDGIPFSDFESLRSQFLSAYGYHKLPLLLLLENIGILKRQSSKPSFSIFVKKLNLLQQNNKPDDVISKGGISSVFDGFYAPLLCKLIECQIFNTEAIEDLKNDFDIFYANDQVRSYRHHVLVKALGGKEPARSDRNILVFFLGGCTHTELNALRIMASNKGYSIYFATTSVYTHERFIESLETNVL